MDDIVKICIDLNNSQPIINSNIYYNKLTELNNKELLYTLVGIFDNAKQKINYLIECMEDEENAENDYDEESEDFDSQLNDEINRLINGDKDEED
ncbi:MAG TPA: hypothetical protein PLI22_03980 [Caldisericia bacterium]|nr:hypothetical protein [Caldisericia bacterium]